ncbi:MAG: DUF362 domain-containing protein, partial [Nanoarchaeota archaeon]|nr:DUF362 domain-containing protein [Nanoarchaeota archaeon]
ERMKASSHVKLAREHGFTAMDIDILDDENGDEYVEIDGCKIGQGIEKYDSLIILTHFKGHGLAGFGGALKNVGMGLGSRAGKLFMHSDISPSINNNCIGCGLCAQHCSAKAICLNEGKAVIDSSKCIGCAMCIAVCSNKAVDIPWDGSTPEKLQRKTINYANAVVNKIGREKIIYINVLKNITKNCDCMAINEKSIMEDIGIIAGYNIVAIEKASLDLARKNCDAFDKMNDVDKDFPVNYAESIRLGTKDYEIENLWKK